MHLDRSADPAVPANTICTAGELIAHAVAHLRAGETESALGLLDANKDLAFTHPFAAYLGGLLHAVTGNCEAALSYYETALALAPGHDEAQLGRATMLLKLERFDEALRVFEAIAASQKGSAELHHNLASAHLGVGNREAALSHYAKALAIDGHFEPALSAYGLLLKDLGRLDEALAVFERLLKLSPSDATAWHNHAVILNASGNPLAALSSFRQALTLCPDHALALYGTASALKDMDRPAEALAVLDALVRRAPGDADAHFLRGEILSGLQLWPQALAAFEAVIEREPANARALVNKGAALRELKRTQEAKAEYIEALGIDPNLKEGWLGLGNADLVLGLPDLALKSFEEALALAPTFAEAHAGRALALKEKGAFEAAMAGFGAALVLDPDNADARANRAVLQLLLGNFEEGWEGFEHRWVLWKKPKAEFPLPFEEWRGQKLAGKKILVLDEAGLGDVIQFSRYFVKLADLGAEVTFAGRPRLHKLLASLPPQIRLVSEPPPGESFDYCIHLLSLPRAFKTQLSTIPAEPCPYLWADSQLVAKWAMRLGDDGFKIGLCWQGNPDPRVDAWRSAPLAAFAPLAAIPGVRLISLQKNAGSEQLAEAPFTVETLGEAFDTGPDAFADTAAVMANIDLIVSVDTSIAHLAGALGRPVFVALKKVPEWRWLLGRDDSPWYPTMRLFRQTEPSDWSGPVARMGKVIAEFAAKKSSRGQILIPGAVGDLIDKITILEIKAARIPDAAKLKNVRRELARLIAVREGLDIASEAIAALTAELKRTNEALWEIEDRIRVLEQRGDFGAKFIELARRVYKENDKRAALKRKINELSGSRIMEEKYFTALQS